MTPSNLLYLCYKTYKRVVLYFKSRGRSKFDLTGTLYETGCLTPSLIQNVEDLDPYFSGPLKTKVGEPRDRTQVD